MPLRKRLAAPTEVLVASHDSAGGLLGLLPLQLLQQSVLAKLHGKAGSNLRPTCHYLRDTFDTCNTQLSLGSKSHAVQLHSDCKLDQIAASRDARMATRHLTTRLLKLLQRSPCITTLMLQPQLYNVSLQQVMQAGGMTLHRHLTRLCLWARDDVKTLQPIASCTALTHLDLNMCLSIQSLQPLTSCPALTHLSVVGGQNIDNLQPLSVCTALCHLHLAACRQACDDLQPLTALTALEHLCISECSLFDLTPITTLTGLRFFKASNTLIEDLTLLTLLPRLQRLDVSDCPELTGISPLTACTGLCSLALNLCTNLTDLSPLGSLTSLTRLELDSVSIESLQPLTAVTALKHLTFGSTFLYIEPPILTCMGLTRLNISGHGYNISKLDFLTACTRLEWLELSDMYHLRNITPLSACQHLQRLKLARCNQLEDLRPLLSCSALQHLDLEDIWAFAEGLDALSALPHLRIDHQSKWFSQGVGSTDGETLDSVEGWWRCNNTE